MSSHREAPGTMKDPVADNTDVYAFVSPDRPDTVTLIANWIPLEEPAGGPHFYKFGDDARFRTHIDNNGGTIDDVVYQFRFRTEIHHRDSFLYNTGPVTAPNDPDLNVRQLYSVARIADGKTEELGSDLTTPPVNVGVRSTT